MTTSTERLDVDDLQRRVQDVYQQVAEQPHRTYHFELVRGLALRLGYPQGILDSIPAPALESFAGVGYFLDLAAPLSGERVLDLGGRLALADIVAARPLAESITCNAELWAACVGGAAQIDEYLGAIEHAGLRVDTTRESTPALCFTCRVTDSPSAVRVT